MTFPPTPRSTLFPYTTLFRSIDRILAALKRHAHNPPRLEVAMGLETAHPHALERLNKRFTLEDFQDRKSTRLNSSHVENSYAVFCLKKKTRPTRTDRWSRMPG